MVKKGSEMDGFDAIKYNKISNPEMAIAIAEIENYLEIELYDKRDILINKIEKLPVLENLFVSMSVSQRIAPQMQGGGVVGLSGVLKIYNCEYDDISDDNLIACGTIYCSQTGATAYTIQWQDIQEDFNIPLRNKITLVLNTRVNQVIAAAVLVADLITFNVFMSIDYRKVSQNELRDWLITEMYVDQ